MNYFLDSSWFSSQLQLQLSEENMAVQHIWWLFCSIIINSQLLPRRKDSGRVAAHFYCYSVFTVFLASTFPSLFKLVECFSSVSPCFLHPFIMMLFQSCAFTLADIITLSSKKYTSLKLLFNGILNIPNELNLEIKKKNRCYLCF